MPLALLPVAPASAAIRPVLAAVALLAAVVVVPVAVALLAVVAMVQARAPVTRLVAAVGVPAGLGIPLVAHTAAVVVVLQRAMAASVPLAVAAARARAVVVVMVVELERAPVLARRATVTRPLHRLSNAPPRRSQPTIMALVVTATLVARIAVAALPAAGAQALAAAVLVPWSWHSSMITVSCSVMMVCV